MIGFLQVSKCTDDRENEQMDNKDATPSNQCDSEGELILSHKERRRTAYMNAAFDALRRCLPDIPPDTKVSVTTFGLLTISRLTATISTPNYLSIYRV